MITLLSRKVTKTLIDTLTDTGDNFSDPVAVPHNCDKIAWQTTIVGAPSAISCKLWGAPSPQGASQAFGQSAPNYVFAASDLQWMELDATADVAGALRHVFPVGVKYLRVEQLSRTGGTSVTIQVTAF